MKMKTTVTMTWRCVDAFSVKYIAGNDIYEARDHTQSTLKDANAKFAEVSRKFAG